MIGVRAVKPVANTIPECTYTDRGNAQTGPAMLNIGKLAPGAADYYIGEVATSAEDYYSGRGESPGRWAGSLARQLGLTGTVHPEAFRAVLEGRHPTTGEHLVSGRSAACRARRLPDRNQAALFDEDSLDVAQTAARLHLTTRRVRQLLAAGVRASDDGSPVRPASTLVGERVRVPNQRGPLAWSIPRSEVERFESERRTIKTRPGYDLTLRPPKSISVLWALADEPRRRAIRDAHREAVDEVIAYYERHACFARRTTAERGRIDTDGLIAAAFDHRTSRAGDPLLHTHVVCANLTRTAEGRWQAIDGRPIYEHAHAAGYLYQAHLRHVLTQKLGVRFSSVRNGYAEVDGVPREVVKAFSKRRDEIEEVVAESGYTSARARQTATLATRKAKDYGVDAVALEATWRSEAEEHGFGSEQVEACFGRPATIDDVDVAALFGELAGSHGLTEQASTFTRQDVVEAIAEAGGATIPARRIDELASAFIASDRVRALAAAPGEPGCGVWRRDGSRERAPDQARFTTPELLDLEQQLLDWALDGFGTPVPTTSAASVEAALERRPELSSEQIAMVRAVCTEAPAVQPVAGRPGSGKTHATAACVDAFLSSGVPVVGCALSAVAAAELEAATALLDRTGRGASTIARLLLDAERTGLAAGTVVVVDEASMVGTRDLARLAALAARAGGSVKLIGDPDQHGSVETGGVFRRLIREHGSNTPQLHHNNRQVHPVDRQAVDEFRQELVELALSRYDAEGRVVRSPSAVQSYDAMVGDWFDGVRSGTCDPMIAGTNRVRRALNQKARDRMVAEGLVAGPEIAAGDMHFQPGDWIVARRNAVSLRSPDRRHFVKNGSAGRVAAVDPSSGSLTVDFTVEGRIHLPAAYVQGGHVEHGYARTSYGVQGATLDRALYHPGDSSSFEEGYVALTRGRSETRIYLVDGDAHKDEASHEGHEQKQVGLETVAEALERRRSKQLALDVDPLSAASRSTYGGLTLAELRVERERLEQILSAAPPSVEDAVASGERERDALLARRQAWQESSAPRRRRIALRGRSLTAAERIEGIERGLAGVDQHLSRLRDRQAARDAFLTEHADDVARLRLLSRAELARELQVRANAVVAPDALTKQRLGDAPDDLTRYQRWRNAVERAAVHTDRYGPAAATEDSAAAWSYERVEAAFRAFADEPEPDDVEPEVLLDA